MINILIKNSFFQLSLFTFCLFFFFYSVNFTFLPVHSYKIIMLILIAYLILTKPKPKLDFNKDIKVFLLFYLGLLFWTILSYIFNEYSDLILVKAISLLLVKSILGVSLFVFIAIKLKFRFKDILLYLQIIITVQAFFILFYFFNVDFKAWTIDYIPATGNMNPLTSVRSRGLLHSSGAMLGLIQSFGLLFSAYYISITNWKSKLYVYFIFSFLLIFLSIFFTGRTGLLMLPMIFLYLLVLYVYRKEYSKNILVFILSLLSLLVFFIGLLFILNYYQIHLFDNTKLDSIISWTVNEFSIRDGKLHSKNLDILSNHWIIPSTLETWIIGNPLTWSAERIKSDIGPIRILHGFGFIGLLLFYGFFMFIFYKTIKQLIKLEERLVVIFLSIVLIITEMKEPFLLKSMVSSFVLFLFLFLFVLSSPLNKNIHKD